MTEDCALLHRRKDRQETAVSEHAGHLQELRLVPHLLLSALKRTTLSKPWMSARCSGLRGPLPTTAMLRVCGRIKKPHRAAAVPRSSGARRIALRSHSAALLRKCAQSSLSQDRHAIADSGHSREA